MRISRIAIIVLLFLAGVSTVLSQTSEQSVPPRENPEPPAFQGGMELLLQKCIICHGKKDFKKVNPDGTVRPLYVDESELKTSVHAKRGCTECHADVKEIPHRERPRPVDCSTCHYKGNPLGAPSDMYIKYQESIHGRESARGNALAPSCHNCHGDHNIRKPEDSKSRVNRYNVATTCGTCHNKELAQYRMSIHGVAVLDQHNIDAPTCVNCHGEHNIEKTDSESSPVSPGNVAKVCTKCHAAEGIVGKYGIETEQIETYRESFHGIAGRLGARTVANCASCHGIHDILPPSDPRSSVNMNNIPKTCGKCHPNTNANYAKGKIHINPKKKEAGIIFWVGQGFKWLTILTMLALVAHIVLDLYRRSRAGGKEGHANA